MVRVKSHLLLWVQLWRRSTMLTDRAVKTAPPGRHGDDKVRGLMLVVKPSGSRSWLLRYQLAGRRRDMGLRSYPEISLARARRKALQARRLIKEGIDPLSDRRFAPPADPHLRRNTRPDEVQPTNDLDLADSDQDAARIMFLVDPFAVHICNALATLLVALSAARPPWNGPHPRVAVGRGLKAFL